MTKRLIPFLLCTLFALQAYTQTPQSLNVSDNYRPSNNLSEQRMMCGDAGSIDLVQFPGQSNDFDLTGDNTIYLCCLDSIQIEHNGDYDLSGDPVSGTAPGIGYLFYDCSPTIDGPDLDDITMNDPCVNTTSPITVNNVDIEQQQGIWVTSSDNQFGDLLIKNEKGLQNAFNNGDPVQFWFAPFTIHNFSLLEIEGSCVNSRVDQAFSIVYLNEIEVLSPRASLGGGSFRVRGGLPEFEGAPTDYTITITKQDDPSVIGTVTSGPAFNNQEVTFTVPEEGVYNICVEDGRSCGACTDIATFLEPPLTFSMPDTTVLVGTNVCLPVTMSGISGLQGFQFGIEYEGVDLTFDNILPNETYFMPGFFEFFAPPGQNRISNSFFLTPPSVIDIPSTIIAFEVCFDVTTEDGVCEDVLFGNIPIPEFGLVINGQSYGFPEEFIIFENGSICTQSSELDVTVTTDPDCTTSTLTTGTVNFMMNNGVPPYSVSWQICGNPVVIGPLPSPTDNISFNSPAGVYCYTITDSSIPSLTGMGTFEIMQGDNLGLNINPTSPISCFGESDGAAEAELVVNNSAPSDISQYTFAWEGEGGTPLGNTQSITGLAAGNVFVTVTDTNNGCTVETSFALSQPLAITLDSVQLNNPGCPGDSDGSINVFYSGGSNNFTYAWSDPLGTDNQVLFGIGQGMYAVSVSDDSGCMAVPDTFNLADPDSIRVIFSDAEDVSCFEGVPCDGQITATVSGGDGGPYDFVWDSGETAMGVTTSTATMLCQGMQGLTVRDAGCGIIDSFMIGSPDPLSISNSGTVAYRPSCWGLEDGSIKVNATGGTPGYSYNWDINGMMATGDSISGLGAGTYAVTVMDVNGCTIPAQLEVVPTDTLIAMVDPNPDTTSPSISCSDASDGFISVFYTGGNIGGDITYNWSPNVSSFSSATGLTAGTYEVTIIDSKGCTDSTSYTITAPTPVEFEIAPIAPPKCFGDRTQLAIQSANGGEAPYTYSINNGVPSSIANAVDVLAGSYLVTVFDANQCGVDTLVGIQDAPELLLDLGPDITIELGESTPVSAFFFGPNPIDTAASFWSPSILCTDTTMLLNFCMDGVVAPAETTEYTLTIVDQEGCIQSDNIIIEVDADRNVFIPNIFTPNADGINDFFSPYVGNGVEQVNFMRIFDRWGDLIYERTNFFPQSDFEFGWDGSFRGKKASAGVYVYIIEVEFVDGLRLLYRGDISLMP